MADKALRLDSLCSEVLPIRIKICYDSCGMVKCLGSDYFDVLFTKHTKMAEVVSSGGMRYLLPLCSSLNCSVLYNPNGDMDKALEGYDFNSVPDLIAAKPTPKMIKVSSGYFCSTSSSIETEEVLIPSGITKQNGHKVLECTELETFTTKYISEDFDCSFTTNPSSLSMLVDDFASQIELPITIVFESLLKKGRKDMYTVTNVFTARSVICSVYHPSQIYENSIQLVELFLDVPIRYKTVKLSNPETKVLQESMHKTFQMICPLNHQKIIINSSTYDNDDIQELFLHSIDENKWESLVQLILPIEVKQGSLKEQIGQPQTTAKVKQAAPISHPHEEEDEEQTYEDMEGSSTHTYINVIKSH